MSDERVSSYTFFTVEHVAEMFVRFGVFADKREYPFVCFIVCAEGYPVQLAIVLHFLGREDVVHLIIYESQISDVLYVHLKRHVTEKRDSVKSSHVKLLIKKKRV